ncbi:MAG TPA: glycosyltransferase, partial [Burkholderiaceae bacterium]|nr:glycosyltransferase [Burkholderiaceae bacterium]
MRPFTVTAPEAGKLPRWLLVLLCALYIVPGLVGRDPWRHDDAAGFGIAYSFAGLATGPVPGSVAWQVPHVFGLPVVDVGPAPFWLAAVAIHLLEPVLAPDTA